MHGSGRGAPVAVGERHIDGRAVGHRPGVFHDEAPQQVVSAQAIAFPIERDDARGAYLLTRMQTQVRQRHAGGSAKLGALLARKGGRPLTAPADGDDDTFARLKLDVEERHEVARRTSSAGVQCERAGFVERAAQRHEVIARTHGALGVVNNGVARRRGEACIERPDLLDDGRVAVAVVAEPHQPLGGGEVGVARHLNTHFEFGCRIFVDELVRIDRFLTPCGQQIGGVLAVVDKRERRRGACRERGNQKVQR